MKYSLFLIILFAPCLLFGQDVIKERLVGWSIYQYGTFKDSSNIHYSSKRHGSNKRYNEYNNPFEYWVSTYDSISSYYGREKPHSTKIFNRNNASGSMDVHFEIRDDSIPASHYLTREYIRIDKKTKNLLEYADYNILTGKEVVNGRMYFEYDQRNNIIKDSMVNYWYGELSGYNTSKRIYSSDNKTFKRIQFCSDSLSNVAGKYTIQFWNTAGLVSQVETYKLSQTNEIENHQIKYSHYDEKSRKTLQINIEINNGIEDTVTYSETKYSDSFDNNGNLIEEVTKIKNNKSGSLINSFRTTFKYDRDKLTQKIWYGWDSMEWVKAQIFDYKYNRDGLLTELTITRSKARTTYIIPSATKHIWKYNNSGHLIADEEYESFDYGLTYGQTAALYYYFEPYLEETTPLNYTQLMPAAYPNPLGHSTNILFSCVPNKEGIITISNLQGAIITQHKFSTPNEIYQYQWQANDVPQGIYLANIVMGKEVATIKLLKQ